MTVVRKEFGGLRSWTSQWVPAGCVSSYFSSTFLPLGWRVSSLVACLGTLGQEPRSRALLHIPVGHFSPPSNGRPAFDRYSFSTVSVTRVLPGLVAR